MKKLKSKIFWILFGILSLVLIVAVFIYNFSGYQEEKSSVKDSLIRMNEPGKNENISSKIVIDKAVYTITLDSNKNVLSITSHNNGDNNTDEVSKYVSTLDIKSLEKRYIGNLYINRYSYSLNGDILIIVDNKETNETLRKTLYISLFISLLFEIFVFLISRSLTGWIIKPVLESFQRQKQFIADASHELKTPISVILASAEALEDDPKEKKWLNNIVNEASRMSDLVTDLLDLAKLEQNNKKDFKLNNLSTIVELSVVTFESLIFEKNLSLNYEIEDRIEFICNEADIRQLVSILLDNAIKHSDTSSEIMVKLYKERDNIYLVVVDQGDEIKEEDERKIFERFYKIDKSRNRNGNNYGLGLAIAKRITENHGGFIEAKSKNGFTTFTVQFKVRS